MRDVEQNPVQRFLIGDGKYFYHAVCNELAVAAAYIDADVRVRGFVTDTIIRAELVDGDLVIARAERARDAYHA